MSEVDTELLAVDEQKTLGRKTDDQGAKDWYAPEFIPHVQVWLNYLPKITVGNWRAQVPKNGNTLTNFRF